MLRNSISLFKHFYRHIIHVVDLHIGVLFFMYTGNFWPHWFVSLVFIMLSYFSVCLLLCSFARYTSQQSVMICNRLDTAPEDPSVLLLM